MGRESCAQLRNQDPESAPALMNKRAPQGEERVMCRQTMCPQIITASQSSSLTWMRGAEVAQLGER